MFGSGKAKIIKKYSRAKKIVLFLAVAFFCVLVIKSTENKEELCDRLCREGDTYFALKEYEMALDIWKRALSLNPESTTIYRKIGMAHQHLSDFNLAQDAFKKLTTLTPDSWDSWIDLAKLCILTGKMAESKDCLELLRNKAPDRPEIHTLQGDIMVIEQKYEEAELAYNRALAISPQNESALIKLAACYVVQGKNSKAEKIYRIVAEKGPESVEMMIQMGNYWKLRGENEKAERFFVNAAEMDPDDMGIQRMLVEFYYDQQYYEKAYYIVSGMVERMPENFSINKLFIEILLGQNQLSEARQLIISFLKEHEKDLGLHMLKGKLHMLSMEYSNSVGEFSYVVASEPNLFVAQYLLGLSYLCKGKNHLAGRNLMKALMLENYFSEADLLLADYYYKNGEMDLCLKHAERVVIREPENLRAYLILGNVMLSRQKYSKAMSRFSRANSLDPKEISSLYFMGLTAELSGQIEKANSIYRSLLSQHPQLADVAMQYAHLLITTGKIGDAKDFFKRIVEIVPTNEYTHHVLGVVYLSADELAPAKLHFYKSIELNPKLVSSYMRLTDIHKREQNPDMEIKELKKCINAAPSFVEAYIKLAYRYMQDGALDESISIINDGMIKNPESPELTNNLACLLLEQGTDVNRALELAQSAYEQLPKDPAVADTMGWAYLKSNLLEWAELYLKESLSGNPNNPLVHFHLGILFEIKGDKVSAIECLSRALALNLAPPFTEEAKNRLRQIRKEIFSPQTGVRAAEKNNHPN